MEVISAIQCKLLTQILNILYNDSLHENYSITKYKTDISFRFTFNEVNMILITNKTEYNFRDTLQKIQNLQMIP